MKKIGITGGIGSGKSTVCKIFETFGVPVYYADIEAKKITNNDPEIRRQLISLYGEEIYLPSGTINREKLAGIIFSNKQELKKVNSIIHPVVKKYYRNWVTENKNHKYLLKEAAILFESGSYKEQDLIITVVSPLEKRIERVQKRDGHSRETVLKKIENQMSDEEKIKKSDFVIYNDDKKMLIPQVLELHKKFGENC